MKPDGPLRALGLRFVMVHLLPTYAAGTFLLILVWSGAPARQLTFAEGWRTLTHLKSGEMFLLAIGILLVALLGNPFQVRLSRLFEGYWPRFLGPLSRHLETRTRRHIQAMRERETQLLATAAPIPSAEIQRAGLLGHERVRHFPAEDFIRPTRLGNVLAAAESRAGRAYGWDAVVAWSRIYPVLGPQMRTQVDDHRNTLDAALRLAAMGTLTTISSAALLCPAGWWLLLAMVPATISVISYNAAVEAALAYGESLCAAFDLHRFDLIKALHLPLPATREREREQASELCAFWRQGKPASFTYAHDPQPTETPAAPPQCAEQ